MGKHIIVHTQLVDFIDYRNLIIAQANQFYSRVQPKTQFYGKKVVGSKKKYKTKKSKRKSKKY